MRAPVQTSKVFELGSPTGRWFKKYFSACRPSLSGISVYKDVKSIENFLPEKLKVGKISSTWLLSKIWKGSDLTVGVMILSKYISSVGQLHAETLRRPE